ncbi:MAG: hypothetical protein R2864_15260 [Syntrophotaleaceae bacterium]
MRINAVKVFVIGTFTLVALAVFIRHGQVNYGLTWPSPPAMPSGGIVATQMAIKRPRLDQKDCYRHGADLCLKLLLA